MTHSSADLTRAIRVLRETFGSITVIRDYTRPAVTPRNAQRTTQSDSTEPKPQDPTHEERQQHHSHLLERLTTSPVTAHSNGATTRPAGSGGGSASAVR